MTDRYKKIINMPHHKSSRHPSMPVSARAAQFAPYAALSGYGDEVNETARLTASRIDLDDYEIERLDRMLRVMEEKRELIFAVTYFAPDKRKKGGEYVTSAVSFGKFSDTEGILITSDGIRIPINDIIDIEEIKPE